jgi:histidinol-phosphate aminotransferase
MQAPSDGLLRKSLRGFTPYRPGTSADEVRRRYGIAHPVKLSQNENPLGTSPKAVAAARSLASYSEYIEDDHRVLRERLAAPYGLSLENVILGHGSNELIQLAFATFADPGDEIVVADPTFSLFRKYADVSAARTLAVPLRDGVHDLDAMLAAVTDRTKIVFVCDPNNPTGTRVEREKMFAFARALREDVLLVIDQAYREYAGDDIADGVDVLATRSATLVTRTASKIYGLAAVRFGYGYSSPQIVEWMNRVRLPFNVAAPAAASVLAALDDRDFFDASIANNERGKAYLYGEFARLGLEAYPTAANFIAVTVPTSASAAYEALLARGVIVRSGDGLGMPGRLRVTVGTEAQNRALIEAMETLVPQWRGEPAGVGR